MKTGIGFLLLLLSLNASAATFVVTSPEDEVDTNPGDGICGAASGCTLRAAVMEANAL